MNNKYQRFLKLSKTLPVLFQDYEPCGRHFKRRGYHQKIEKAEEGKRGRKKG